MEDIEAGSKERVMMASEYMSTVLLRAREEQLLRDLEILRVARERQAQQPPVSRRPGGLMRAVAALPAQLRRGARRAAPAQR
jgi:hypothetical protein